MSPRSLTEHFSEVLLALNHHCPVLLAQWLEETLQAPGFPSAEVSSEQKHTFSQELLRSVTVLYLTSPMQLRHGKKILESDKPEKLSTCRNIKLNNLVQLRI